MKKVAAQPTQLFFFLLREHIHKNKETSLAATNVLATELE